MKDICFICDLNQTRKVSEFLKLDKEVEEKLLKTTQTYLDTCDMKKTNPEIMAEIWKEITPILKTDNPYKEIKSYYNQLLLSLEDSITLLISKSKDSLLTALKLVITGNLIDFAAKHTFNKELLLEMINTVEDTHLVIDDSMHLFSCLNETKTLLYLGDNCGEIVLDKYFIKLLKEHYPRIHVYYGVRGKAIVNDVTIEDAIEVHMDEVATVISNGDGALGTVLKNTSLEFQEVFNKSDVVICKGQGNYEGLYSNKKENLFFMFMAKCELVSKPIGVDTMSIVCMKNRKDLKWGI